MAEKKPHKWIKTAIKHPGALRESLHAPEGKPIPEAKLEKAEHSENPKLAKEAHLAKTLKSFHHGAAKADRLYRAKKMRKA